MYLLIMTSNVNGLNAAIKRHGLAEWIRIQDPYICCVQDTHLSRKDMHRLKAKAWKRYFMQTEMKKKTHLG